ncbi:MAG: LemA family protein [Bdellovibrio sp.]|nr:LemA family protein [Bdellovibrio sp.]
MTNKLSYAFILVLSFLLYACGMRSIPQADNQVEAAWADVQNQYKRRADLVPNLVSVVKSYAQQNSSLSFSRRRQQ